MRLSDGTAILFHDDEVGGRATFYIVLIFYISMVAAGVIVDLLFSGAGLIPQGSRPISPVEHATFSWNYTTWLNIVFLGLAALLVWRVLKTGGPEMLRMMNNPAPAQAHQHW